ncbi:MAG TPA: hypothetical protein VF447_14245 [Terriglobales bacterium]
MTSDVLQFQEASGIRVLVLDVFETGIDWRSSIVQEVRSMDLDVDGNQFSLA